MSQSAKSRPHLSREWHHYAERRYLGARISARARIRGTAGVVRFHARVSATAFLKACLVSEGRVLPEVDSATDLLTACLNFAPTWQRYADFCSALDVESDLIGYPGDVTTLSMARSQLRGCSNLRRAARRHLKITYRKSQ